MSPTSEPDPLEATPTPDAEGAYAVDARAVLFGFDPVAVRVNVVPRPRRWRVVGALRTGALFLVVAPVVGILPPHAPWIIGALGAGGFLARRRLNHHFTLMSVEGACPKCGAGFNVRPGQLKSPHTLPCDGCHHEARLDVAAEDLEPVTALAN